MNTKSWGLLVTTLVLHKERRHLPCGNFLPYLDLTPIPKFMPRASRFRTPLKDDKDDSSPFTPRLSFCLVDMDLWTDSGRKCVPIQSLAIFQFGNITNLSKFITKVPNETYITLKHFMKKNVLPYCHSKVAKLESDLLTALLGKHPWEIGGPSAKHY